MKSLKLKILAVSLCVLLLAGVAAGSLAWFNDSDTVVNRFRIASSSDGTDAEFDIDVFEYDGTDAYHTDGITYTDVMPGMTMVKKASVKNTSTSDAFSEYVRVIITFDNGKAWNDAGIADFTQSFGNFNALFVLDGAVIINDVTGAATAVYYLNDILTKDETVSLFDSFSVPSELTTATLNDFSISVKADAIQAQYILDGVDVTGLTVSECAKLAFAQA